MTIVITVLGLVAALEASRRWPVVGIVVGLGLLGLGGSWLADVSSHGRAATCAESNGVVFVQVASVLVLVLGAIWLLASIVAVRARRKRRIDAAAGTSRPA
jgi:hypothetical protein